MSEQKHRAAAQVALARKALELRKRNEQRSPRQAYRQQRSRRQRTRHHRRPARLQDNGITEPSDAESADDDQPDTLVPDAVVCRELGGISRMTLHRRTREDPDFPAQVQVAGRNYRFRSALEIYKRRLLDRAMRGQRQRLGSRCRESVEASR